MKVAIVGCGKIADGHLEELLKLRDRVEIVGVCDREPVMAEQISDRLGVGPVFTDLGDMLARAKPDVVHVTTPPGAHRAIAEQCAAGGAHVVVEKPLALTFAESKALVEAVSKHKKLLTIGYTYYFDPTSLRLRELMPQIGNVVHAEAFYGYNLAGAFGQALLGDENHWVHALPGKLFHNVIDHPLSMVMDFLGPEVSVSAHGFVRRKERYGDKRDRLMDELRVLLRSGGTTATITFSAYIRPASHFVRVYGDKASAHADYNTRTVTLDHGVTLPSAIGRLTPAFGRAREQVRAGVRNLVAFGKSDYHFFTGFRNLFTAFYDAVERGGPPPIAYDKILMVADVMDRVFREVDQHGERAGDRAALPV